MLHVSPNANHHRSAEYRYALKWCLVKADARHLGGRNSVLGRGDPDRAQPHIQLAFYDPCHGSGRASWDKEPASPDEIEAIVKACLCFLYCSLGKCPSCFMFRLFAAPHTTDVRLLLLCRCSRRCVPRRQHW